MDPTWAPQVFNAIRPRGRGRRERLVGRSVWLMRSFFKKKETLFAFLEIAWVAVF